MIANADFHDTSLFDVEYLRNDTRYKHSWKVLLSNLSDGVISSDLEWSLWSRRSPSTKYSVSQKTGPL